MQNVRIPESPRDCIALAFTDWRFARGCATLAEVAECFGVSQATVSRWEAGEVDIKLVVLSTHGVDLTQLIESAKKYAAQHGIKWEGEAQ